MPPGLRKNNIAAGMRRATIMASCPAPLAHAMNRMSGARRRRVQHLCEIRIHGDGRLDPSAAPTGNVKPAARRESARPHPTNSSTRLQIVTNVVVGVPDIQACPTEPGITLPAPGDTFNGRQWPLAPESHALHAPPRRSIPPPQPAHRAEDSSGVVPA